MAQDEQSTTTRTTAPKRLARAKVKHPTSAGADKDGRAAKGMGSIAPGASRTTKARLTAQAKREQEAKAAEERQGRWAKIGIGAFAVVMALAMMIPSCSSIFALLSPNTGTTTQVVEGTTEDATTDSQVPTTVAGVDEAYAAELATLEAKLADDPNNLAAILSLGELYLRWGYNASYYAATDEELAHVTELFDTSIAYYDRYLELNDSNAVKVNRALAQLYSGDFDAALASLEALVAEAPDYGPAWANLGMVREYTYDTEGAKAAYEQAIATDPDDEYGAKTYASQRLAALNASAMEESTLDDVVTEQPAQGLSETLAEASGTNY